MQKPILCFTEERDAKQAAERLRPTEIAHAIGHESDREKTIHTLFVEVADQEKALEAIGESALDSAIRCPACNAPTIEFPARPRASGLLGAVSAIGDAVVPPKQQPFQCLSCDNRWS